MLIKELKRILKDPSRLKTLSVVRPHVFDAFVRYLINNRGIISQLVCSALNISYVLLKKDMSATSRNMPTPPCLYLKQIKGDMLSIF